MGEKKLPGWLHVNEIRGDSQLCEDTVKEKDIRLVPVGRRGFTSWMWAIEFD